MEGTFMGKLYTGLDWFVKLTYLQLLYAGFIILGLFFGGLFPATAALMATVRQWIRGRTDLPLFSTYRQYFRAYFVQANIIGYIICFVSTSLVLYVYWFMQIGGVWANILIYVTFLLLLFMVVITAYWIPVLVHFELKGFKVLKQAFWIAVIRPFHTIGLVVLVIVLFLWTRFMPGLLPILNVSLLAFGWMWITHHAFEKFDVKADS
ncbi:YesL family protein [Chengkuizengella axinellae]|uniref:DUF624 domain-containing protein n=1 Tax=Chengkuizengella axinellae TaxID=3064388 RepID=A0ABT9IZR4_9BACL|nr:DUF624 domain-containing protein [Chengkuizengella sp. 2205SS18-9]MDP5274805.1 DUF624 domain-containing protein [Chengkuizengella sp. 2205SS18-9]